MRFAAPLLIFALATSACTTVGPNYRAPEAASLSVPETYAGAPGAAPAAQHKNWVMLAGMLGYAARGAVFVIAAWLLYRAWSSSSPAAAGGLGDVLAFLSEPLRNAVAAPFSAASLLPPCADPPSASLAAL